MFIKLNKILIGVIAVLVLCSKAYSKDNILYVSPGITFGWNIGNGFTVTPKMSLGIFNVDKGNYFNITYGCNYGPRKEIKNNDYGNYQFFEVEGGSVRHYSGGGAGIAFFNSGNERHVCPKLTAFTGLIFFINMDMIITIRGIHTNFGIQPNLPIPLQDPEYKFSLGG